MMPAGFRLGKSPARPHAMAMRLQFKDYLSISALPAPPASFGHDGLIGGNWGMLANDNAGCCVWSGAAHETMLYNKEAGIMVSFNDAAVLGDYSAVTGYKIGDPTTDNGTDMQVAADYRRTTGVLDANGKRHKIGVDVALQPGNVEEHLAAAWLFQAVGIGIKFPGVAMDQFQAGQPWDVVPGAEIEGGHYIPWLAQRDTSWIVTWGKEQAMTEAFFHTYNDESFVYLSPEMLVEGKTIDGFDLEQLQADLAKMTQ